MNPRVELPFFYGTADSCLQTCRGTRSGSESGTKLFYNRKSTKAHVATIADGRRTNPGFGLWNPTRERDRPRVEDENERAVA